MLASMVNSGSCVNLVIAASIELLLHHNGIIRNNYG